MFSQLNDEIDTKCDGGKILVERTAITDQMDAIKASGKNGVFPFYCPSTNADFPTIGYCMCIGIIYNPGVSVIIGINSQTGEIWTNGNISQNAGAWRGWKKLS